LRDTADAGLFRRTLAVVEAAAGRPFAGIARMLRTSRVSIYHWIACYEQAQDPTALVDQRGGNHPSLWTEDLQTALLGPMSSPSSLDFPWVGDLRRKAQPAPLSCLFQKKAWMRVCFLFARRL
jgi:hypothetical protein